MRIRKRTPARAASPGPSPPLSPSPPPPLMQPASKEVPPPRVENKEAEEKRVILVAGDKENDEAGEKRVILLAGDEENDEADEKRVILVAGDGGREDGRVVVPLPAASTNSSATVTNRVPKPADRCSRNDGKRWRCKNAAVPGFLFCDRHVEWSARQRQRQPGKKKAKKTKSDGGAFLEHVVPAEEEEQVDDRDMGDGDDDGFYYYGGFQPRGRDQARGGGPGPAGGGVNKQP